MLAFCKSEGQNPSAEGNPTPEIRRVGSDIASHPGVALFGQDDVNRARGRAEARGEVVNPVRVQVWQSIC